MPETVNTHCQIVSGAAAVAVTETVISGAPMVLPAGGPWNIHHVFCQIASITATAAESLAGMFRFDPLSGDISPDPSPSRFPVAESHASLGATINNSACALNLFNVNWVAAGKSSINCVYANGIAVSAIPQVVMGMVFSKTPPTPKPILFCDRARAAKATAAESLIGTIQLSERATRITGIMGMLLRNGVLVTAEELIGQFRLASDDVGMSPSQWPFIQVCGAGLGALINGPCIPPFNFIPVDIEVTAGARISVYATLNTAVTNAADVEVFVAYE